MDTANKAVEIDRYASFLICNELLFGLALTDSEYKIHETVGQAVVDGYNKAVEFEKEHQVTQRVGEAIVNGTSVAISSLRFLFSSLIIAVF